MKIIIDTDLIKRYVEDNHVGQVIYDDSNSLSNLDNLVINGETIWYPCYKGHTEVIDEAVAPTCTEPGLTEGSHCSICGATVVAQEFVPATGHKYSSVLQAATCTEPGLETHTCIYCDDSYEVILDALGHDYGDWTITLEPTCLLAGSKRRDCRRSICDHYETETIPALGHNPVPIPKVWPTCTETGLTEGSKCMTCGTVLEVQRPIPALGHTLGEWIIDTEPTVNSTGSRHKECTFCGEVIETEVIPKLDSLTYTLSSDGTYYSVKAANTDIRSNTDTDGLIIIPSEYNGIPVTEIDIGAFEDCRGINRVIIPDSITYINTWAFDNAGITTVTIPNSVTKMGVAAFGDCDDLKTVYFDPNSQLTSIPASAFSGCSTLGGIEIPDSVTSIGERAFKGCSLLTGVEIGNSVTSIGDEAFYGCAITNVVIPDSVTSIGERAFMGSSLKSANIPASVTHIGSQAFASINLLEAEITLLNKDCWKTTGTRTDGTLEDIYIDVDAHTSRELAVLLTQSYSYYEWNATAHTYGDWYVTVEPTCVATGLKRRDCANCGHYETDIVPISDEHVYESVVTAPTCTEQGYTTHTCTVCGRMYIDSYVPALGHSYTSSTTLPTCTAKGYTTHTCTRCGDSYIDSYVEAKGHSYKSVVTAPTCTAQGYTTYTCATCGHTYKDNYTAALGHNWKDATCTTPKTCSTCGATEGSALGHDWGEPTYQWNASYTSCTATRTCNTDSSHKQTVSAVVTSKTNSTVGCVTQGITVYTATFDEDWAKTQTYTKTTPATGHSYKSVVTAPTCTAQGYTTYTCSVCGHSYKDNYVAATGHSWNASTYSWSGYSSCTATRTCKTNSSHTETATATITSSVTKAATCTATGIRTYTATFSASWAATQTKTETIPATGHNYSTKKVGATCTAQGYDLHTCATCGISYKDNYTDALGHNYGSWTTTTQPTCTATGTQRRDCSRCDAYETQTIAALGHKYSSVVTAPTCTAQGYTTHTCSTCGDSYVDTYTAAKGHTWSAWSITSPTCTMAGNKRRTCSVCSAIDTELVPATGHNWKDATCTTPKTCSVCGATEGTTASHTEVSYPYVAPTATTVGYTGGSYCSVCGEVIEARDTILMTPVITDAVLSRGASTVDVWVQNNNGVPVTCYIAIYDDTGAEVYSSEQTIPANTSNYITAEYSSTAVMPLECYVYFAASGYEDSAENSVVIS